MNIHIISFIYLIYVLKNVVTEHAHENYFIFNSQ